MKRMLAWLAVTLFALAIGATQAAETNTLRIARNFGTAYLQLMIMQHQKLVEKHAKAAGLGDLTVEWSQFASGSVMNDALLAGKLDVASGGVPPYLTLWSRTQGNLNVKGITTLCSMPLYLVTRNASIKSVRDYGPSDRISVAGAGSSIQTIVLQMAVAKELGIANYAKLNPNMINLPHPDGLGALLAGDKQIESLLSAPPYQNQALERPGVHRVFSSYEVLGGPATFDLVWTTGRFREANPKTYQAVVAALEEATQIINKDKRAAAELYKTMANDKTPVDELYKLLAHPEMEFTTVPNNIMKYVDFMSQTGQIKVRPATWKDLFFPNLHERPGS
jgi:NitT/TauT family transport system substrate-binding protein